MNILKRTCVISLIALIVLMSAVNGRLFSYAEVDSSGWTQVSSNEQLVQAFKAYCKSRNLAIEGSLADAVTSFTTTTFNNICNTLGIDITQLQADIKYRSDGNIGLRWLFNTSGATAFNRIFAEFLQNNNLSVGDSANETNNTVYNGKYFQTFDGYNVLLFITDSNNLINPNNSDTLYSNLKGSNIISYGSYYKYSPSYIRSLPTPFTLNLQPIDGLSINIKSYNWISGLVNFNSGYTYSRYAYQLIDGTYCSEGYPIIFYNQTNNTYHLGVYTLVYKKL